MNATHQCLREPRFISLRMCWVILSIGTFWNPFDTANAIEPPANASQSVTKSTAADAIVPLDPKKLDEITRQIEHNESLVKGLRVRADAKIRQRTGFDDEGPELEREIQVVFAVDEKGRIRSLKEGGTPGQIGTTQVFEQRTIGTFDGKLVRILQGKDQYDWGYIGPEKSRIPREVDPRNYLHHFHNQLISKLLSEKYRIRGPRKWREREVVLIESEPTVNDGVGYKGQILLDPRHDYSPISRSLWIRFEKIGPEWHEYTHTDTTDFKRSTEGVWLPAHGLYTSYNIKQEQIKMKKAPTIAWQFDVTFHDWEINPKFEDRDFTLEFPPGIFIQDDSSK